MLRYFSTVVANTSDVEVSATPKSEIRISTWTLLSIDMPIWKLDDYSTRLITIHYTLNYILLTAVHTLQAPSPHQIHYGRCLIPGKLSNEKGGQRSVLSFGVRSDILEIMFGVAGVAIRIYLLRSLLE